MKFQSIAACVALSFELGNDKVAFKGYTNYTASIASYFSQQAATPRPYCIVQPTNDKDVSAAVRVVVRERADFAIRSGGHTTWAGAANIDDGVTIDLRALNSITLSEDSKTVSVGPGATWGQVYEYLDAFNLSAAGGRAANVGVGGLATGGGISYFSPRFGWTCDTVSNYQVVLANGDIVSANKDQNPDLLRALRGGSNNYGIVTRIDLDTFASPGLWGGVMYSPIETAPQQLEAFDNFNNDAAYDEFSSLITTFGYSSTNGGSSVVVNSIEYTKPVSDPRAFREFRAIPTLFNTLRIANMSNISAEQTFGVPNGQRQFYQSITTGSSLEMLNMTHQRWQEGISAVKDVKGLSWSLSLEPMPSVWYMRGTFNSLGLETRPSKSYVINLMSAQWSDEKDDERMLKAIKVMFDGLAADAKRLGQDDSFLYLNYATAGQPVLQGYGQDSIKRLQNTRKRFDPKGIFTNKVPGGFKVPAA